MYDWGYKEKTNKPAYEKSIDNLVKVAQNYGDSFKRYFLDEHEQIHDW